MLFLNYIFMVTAILHIIQSSKRAFVNCELNIENDHVCIGISSYNPVNCTMVSCSNTFPWQWRQCNLTPTCIIRVVWMKLSLYVCPIFMKAACKPRISLSPPLQLLRVVNCFLMWMTFKCATQGFPKSLWADVLKWCVFAFFGLCSTFVQLGLLCRSKCD